MGNKKWKGAWIPEELYHATDLSWIEKILFTEIYYLDGKNGCFASNQHLAKFLKVSIPTISVGISKFKKLGLVKVISFDGRKRILKTNFQKVFELKYEDPREEKGDKDDGPPYEFHKSVLKNLRGSHKNSINIGNKSIDKENNEKKLLSKESNICFSSKNSQPKNSLISNKKRTLKRRKKSSYPITLNPFVPKAIKEIVSYWNSNGLQNHKDPTTKLFRKIIISVNRLNKGTFFKSLSINGNYSQYKTKKWTQREILQAISNFSLAATNCDYLPKSEKSKEWMRKQSLPNFLWNEYAPDGSEKSLLLKYFEDKPKLSKQSMRPLTDNHPKMTSAIQRVYNEMTSNNLAQKNIPVNINNCFIKAAKREAEFIKKLIKQRLIDTIYIRTNRSRAELFINASLSNLKSPKERLYPAKNS